jgi:hypothetical protein
MNYRKRIGAVMKTAVVLFVVGVSLTLLLAEGLGVVVGLFVTLLLSGGLGFTLREFKRLSENGTSHKLAVSTKYQGRAGNATASPQRVA